MEITKFLRPTLTSARATSSVEDGDVGQNGNFYRNTRKKSQTHRGRNADDIPPQVEGSTSRIDILV